MALIPTTLSARLRRFWGSPAKVKYLILARRFPARKRRPAPLQLDFGMWWLAEESALDRCLMGGSFEDHEIQFVRRFLRPGATMLDVGAHHGLYTLLASHLVGSSGCVVSVEPSPREFRRLRQHVILNSCRNVHLQPIGLSQHSGEAELFLVEGEQDWCNSFRPPAVSESTIAVRVPVKTLDLLVRELALSKVDFVKLDVEGAELSVLKGGSQLFRAQPRPIILIEVQEIRTRPWGYHSKEIVEFLSALGYYWFRVAFTGALLSIELGFDCYDGNFVACPPERLREIDELRMPRAAS